MDGENHFAAVPTALYGVVLLAAAYSYLVLQRAIVVANGAAAAPLVRAVGADRKGLASRLMYMAAVVAAFWQPWIAWALYVAVALLWFVPDRRIERVLVEEEGAEGGSS